MKNFSKAKSKSAYFPEASESDFSSGSFESQNLFEKSNRSFSGQVFNDEARQQRGSVLQGGVSLACSESLGRNLFSPNRCSTSQPMKTKMFSGAVSSYPSTADNDQPVFYGAIRFPHIQSILWDRTPLEPPSFITPESVLPMMVIHSASLKTMAQKLEQDGKQDLWRAFTFEGGICGIHQLDDGISALLPPPLIQEAAFALVLDAIDCSNGKTFCTRENAWDFFAQAQVEATEKRVQIPAIVTHFKTAATDRLNLNDSEYSFLMNNICDALIKPATLALNSFQYLQVVLTLLKQQDRAGQPIGQDYLLRAEAIMPNLKFRCSKISALPILNTALHVAVCKGFSGTVLRQSNGYLTLNETRKVVLMLESDAVAYSSPVVGVWLLGLGSEWEHVCRHPAVWAACIRFLTCPTFQTEPHHRVCVGPYTFLLVWFPERKDSKQVLEQSLFFEVTVFPLPDCAGTAHHHDSRGSGLEITFSHFDYAAGVSVKPGFALESDALDEDSVIGKFRCVTDPKACESFQKSQARVKKQRLASFFENATPIPQEPPVPHACPTIKPTSTFGTVQPLQSTTIGALESSEPPFVVKRPYENYLNVQHEEEGEERSICIKAQNSNVMRDPRQSPMTTRRTPVALLAGIKEPPIDSDETLCSTHSKPILDFPKSSNVLHRSGSCNSEQNPLRWSWAPACASPAVFHDPFAQRLILAQQEQLVLLQKQLARIESELETYKKQERTDVSPVEEYGMARPKVNSDHLQSGNTQEMPNRFSQSQGTAFTVEESCKDDELSLTDGHLLTDEHVSESPDSSLKSQGTNTSFLHDDLPAYQLEGSPKADPRVFALSQKYTPASQGDFLGSLLLEDAKEFNREEEAHAHESRSTTDKSSLWPDENSKATPKKMALNVLHPKCWEDDAEEVKFSEMIIKDTEGRQVRINTLEQKKEVSQNDLFTGFISTSHSAEFCTRDVQVRDLDMPRILFSFSDIEHSEDDEESESLQVIEARYFPKSKFKFSHEQRNSYSFGQGSTVTPQSTFESRDVLMKQALPQSSTESIPCAGSSRCLKENHELWSDNFLDSSIKAQTILD